MSFCFFFIARIRSIIASSCGWMYVLSFFCNSNHCCFITVDVPDFSILVFPRRHMSKIEVRSLFFPNIVTVVHRPSRCWSAHLEIMVEEIFAVQWWWLLQVCSYCSKRVMNHMCTVIFFGWVMLVSIRWIIFALDGISSSWR